MRSGTKTLLILLSSLVINASCTHIGPGSFNSTNTPTPGGTSSRTPSLLRSTERTGNVPETPDPAVVRSRNVIVDLQRLQAGARLQLPLFDRESLVIVIDRQEEIRTRDQKRGTIWYGRVAGQPGSAVVLAIAGNTVAGTIHATGDRIYRIRSVGNDIHALQEIDPEGFPNEAEPEAPKLPAGGEDADTCATDPPSDIDALVVYTDDARAAAGGTDAIEATIFLALAETNLSYVNSQVAQRLRLAYMEEVSYVESKDSLTDLNRLREKADGVLDNVHSLRDTHAADVTMMITEALEPGNCGRAYIMESVSNAFESFAFGVVRRSCATGNFSFGHELGHIMSARHDWAVDTTNNSPYAYNHGFVNTTPTAPATPWRTIMAYNGTPSSKRLPFWSNPNVNFPPGDPMGVAGGAQQADNHKTLDNTALTVANFRCRTPEVGNVWMKDTWKDTGAEPDPQTAAEEMWLSPYIWIRNAQDTDLTHQHQHENPVFGATNWAYTKLHNGGAAMTSGTLELYWANASVSLTWPTGWTLLASVPVNNFTAHSTRIVEAKWASLPGKGHYCIVARWVSASDPMTHAETADISQNVRRNNNLIWRNLNIVDLAVDQDVTTSLLVRNLESENATSLTIGPPLTGVNDSFIRHGRLSVRFDGPLMEAWRRGGARGTGFKRDGGDLILTDPAGAVFEGISLARGEEGHAELTFTRLPTTPKQQFIIHARQLHPDRYGRANVVVGGVSYEIYTGVR